MPVVPTAPRAGYNHMRANLHCCADGSSDKLWALYAQNAKDNGPVVTVWGRNGGKMHITEMDKGRDVDIPKLIQSKLAKGYKPYPRLAHPHLPGKMLVSSPSVTAWLKTQKLPSSSSGSTAKRPSDCPAGKIRNPETKRCVSKSGPIGKRLLLKPRSRSSDGCASDQIRNPASGRCVSRTGPTGKRLLSRSSCASGQIRNPATGRCVSKTGAIGKALVKNKRKSPKLSV